MNPFKTDRAEPPGRCPIERMQRLLDSDRKTFWGLSPLHKFIAFARNPLRSISQTTV